MILSDKTDQQLLEILAWPTDYNPAYIDQVEKAFQERRLHKTKSKRLAREFLEKKVEDMLRGVRRLDEIDEIPKSNLFTRKEVESCIRRQLKAKQDKSSFLRKHTNGGNYLTGI